MVSDNVRVREVGLRDGLQIIRAFLPTEHKKTWIDYCSKAGFQEIEATSFVPAKYIPQFVDAAEIVAHATAKPHLQVAAFTPNVKGAELALAAGVHKITCVVSSTESFNQANLRRSRADSLRDAKDIIRLRNEGHGNRRVVVQGALSSAFGCPFEGIVSDKIILELLRELLKVGVDEISVADTVGYANPTQVRRLCRAILRETGDLPVGLHLHDTRGTGLANVLAGLDAGIRYFDSSLGGLGGCPNAPRATGNITTEDLVYMLEAMGLNTGIDMDVLFKTREFVRRQLPDVPMFGHIADAGLPKGFHPAQSQGPISSDKKASR